MLKLMTLNLNYLVEKHGPWPARMELIARSIDEEKPDIVAFQAVKKPSGSEMDQANELACRLYGYPHVVFLPANSHEDGSSEGSGFISRLPAQQVDFLRLTVDPEAEDPSPRVVLRTSFRLGDGSVIQIFNGYFSWIPRQTLSNVSETLAFARASTGPAILLGDFNATPDTEAMRNIHADGWVDAWVAEKPQEDGFTFESQAPTIRIDYIWIRDTSRDKLQDIRTVGRAGEPAPRLSDHLGLVAELDFELARY